MEIEDLPILADKYKKEFLTISFLIATFLFFVAFVLWFTEPPLR